jgi:hypothetical protein
LVTSLLLEQTEYAENNCENGEYYGANYGKFFKFTFGSFAFILAQKSFGRTTERANA